MAQNDSEPLNIWKLIDSHFDTALLSDEDCDEIDQAITAYKDKAVEEVLEDVECCKHGYGDACPHIRELLKGEK